jgi:hypothetical protein
LISKLEKDISKLETMYKLNNIIDENKCILKSELKIRFANLTGIVFILLSFNLIFRSGNEKSIHR